MKYRIASSVLALMLSASIASAQSKDAEYLNALDSLNTADIRATLTSVNSHGLKASDYWSKELESLYANDPSSAKVRALAKESYLKLLRTLNAGFVNPETLGKNFMLKRRHLPSAPQLTTMVIASGNNASLLAENIAPKTAHYKSLQEALKRMSTMCRQNEWFSLPKLNTAIKLNSRDTALPSIKNRLRQFGYAISSSDDLFDEETLKAVNNIQMVLHFNPDGVISPNGKTYTYLNTSCAERIEQILAELEKFRWLPRDFGNRYLFVNLAHSYLAWIDKDAGISETMKVIVGRSARQTPTLVDKITYITVNPFWVVPPTIFKEDKLSDLKSLSNWAIEEYFDKNYYQVWDKSFKNRYIPSTINWSAVNDKTPIYIRQLPGLHNALGVLKFNLTNDQAIYLHDTNQRELFSESERQLSSGCVRVERPFDLAEYLLKGVKTRAEIDYEVARRGEIPEKPHNVSVPNPIPVYLVYQTVTMNNDGVMRFAEDHYGQADIIKKASK